MKLFGKKLLAIAICFIMIFGSVTVGGEGFAKFMSVFSVKASADVYFILEDETITFDILPKNEQEVLFNCLETGLYEISFDGDGYVGVWHEGNYIEPLERNEYTGNYVFTLNENCSYIIKRVNNYSDHIITKSVTISHFHQGEEEFIVEPSIASFGVKHLYCKECEKDFYTYVRMTGKWEDDAHISDGIIYSVLSDGDRKEIVVTGCTREAGAEVIIPAKIDGIPVTSVAGGEAACWFCNDKMEKLIVSEGVKSLVYPFFFLCPSLKEIILPESLEMVSEGSLLTLHPIKVKIGSGTKFIDNYNVASKELIYELSGLNLDQDLNEKEIQEARNALLNEISSDEEFIEAVNETGMEFESVEEALDYLIDTRKIEEPGDFIFYVYYYKSLLSVLDNITNDFTAEIDYNGTRDEWNRIVILENNDFPNVRFLGEEPTYTTISDQSTAVEIVINSNDYSGEVTLNVVETSDDGAIKIINEQISGSEQHIYDITILLNGRIIQPRDKIQVKIPLPTGYNPNNTFVYYVNTETGGVENMNAVYENGYMVFETDHFSYYAIVEVNPTASATLNLKSSASVAYRSDVTITATASNLPSGYFLAIYDGNTLLAKGDNSSVSYHAGEMRNSKTFTVKVVDLNGAVQCNSSGALQKDININVSSGFFAKIIAFFKSLFGLLPKVEIKP